MADRRVRQLRVLARADHREAVDDERVDGRLDAQAQRGRLAAALLEIADRDREVLLLVAWAQLTCEEAAQATRHPRGHGAIAAAPSAPEDAVGAHRRGHAMNDLQTLHDAWESPPAPSHEAWTDARVALLERADRRRRRAPLRITALVTAGAIAATFVLVVQNLGDASPVAAAEVFERAAHAAEAKPFTAPRPDQWIYVKDRFVSSDGGRPQTHEMWRQVDGGAMAFMIDGTVKRIDGPKERPGRERPSGPLDSYEAATRLPRDPDALLRWAYREAAHVEGAGLTEDGDVYSILEGLLGGQVLPPDLEAAIFRALKRVPGVTVSTVNVFGRRVLSLAQTEDWLREELFLDPETYAYRGQRGTVVHDAVIDPAKAGNATGEIKKGHTATSVRLRTAIVDKLGER
ncbi:MAG TPA: CU044_5270 family protein [Solirubrobacteraceae bacterium]|nr:CU044_5270 family protein [Solirubrobacteraceae bacterium]